MCRCPDRRGASRTRQPLGHRARLDRSGSLNADDTLVWYAAYGSNLLAARFRFYLEGGTPDGTTRVYSGFRNRRPPVRSAPLTLPGCVYFSGESRVWGGGMAFYAPERCTGWPGQAAARGYLLTAGQFADLVEQEMHRSARAELDLTRVLRDGHDTLGPGRYETLVRVGDLDGHPILTCTAPWTPPTIELRPPSARYLGLIATGLHETHGWPHHRIRAYTADLPGIRDHWNHTDLDTVITTALGIATRRTAALRAPGPD
ncbi:histone deacetylase [Nocardia otitidiscaviarum]|uniref:histone deacetylase n=1 Tax=Nocardia otitidiscaviarum TaxID=1823 RepID=UPI00245601F0|nr:histone deacetylase [Nocardia otitidiscaviarum]